MNTQSGAEKIVSADAVTILIVDDNPQNLNVLERSLKMLGFRVLIASKGETALKRAKYALPDLILLDVLMPGLDGFETCCRLKADTLTKDIPVIFMTALTETNHKVKGFEVGGVDYITKPFQFEEVIARVKTHLTMRNLQRRLEERNARLQEALESIKTLKGLLPICAKCKKIRDDRGYWNVLEKYIEAHTDALFTHGLCPGCLEDLHREAG